MFKFKLIYCVKVICLLLIVPLLSGCIFFNIPPSVENVQQQFNNNFDDIHTIVEYMIGTGYKDVYIDHTIGTATMQADFNRVKISDPNVVDAVERVFKTYYHIFKSGNIITLLQWKGLRDIGCGIVYSIDGTQPRIQYVTELVPLADNGWYYYVDDYEKWNRIYG